jgi:hypothetical protein
MCEALGSIQSRGSGKLREFCTTVNERFRMKVYHKPSESNTSREKYQDGTPQDKCLREGGG